MRVRNKPGAKEKIVNYPQYVATQESAGIWKGKWQQRFKKIQPIHVEVGMGKGRFITKMAQNHPEINYIGVEMQTSVLAAALDKVILADLPNLQLLHVDGSKLNEYFAENEIHQIYLNFSDPWPKFRHEKRRLTHAGFLKVYEEIMWPNGKICFKTDNQGLFEYSLSSLSRYGMSLEQVWLDLHESDFDGNVMTEYEEKFSAKGHPIYRVEARFNESFLTQQQKK